MTATQNARPLDGITVVSIEQAIAAPFASRQLADLGARVIKIERPNVGAFARGYDERVNGLASHFVWTNRSKESLTLDLKAEAAMPVMDKLLAEADVLIQNLAPGAAARLGLSHDALKDRFPRLIVCNISGYGEAGPMTDKKAYDLLIQSEAGMLSLTGGPGATEMAKVGVSIGDIAAGMYAYSQILAAIIRRGVTGHGTSIDVSMLEALVEWVGYPLYYAYDGQEPPPRAGAAHSTIFPYGPFTAGDGKRVMLGLQNEREWAVFCEKVLEQPELTEDARFASNSARSAAREELTEIIHAAFAELSAADVVERLEAAKIANARVNDMAGVWGHEQLAARNRWREVATPAGPVPAPLPPGADIGYEHRMNGVPALGQHSDTILAEYGYDEAAIQTMRDQGVI